MIEDFKSFIDANNLLNSDDYILLTVSGGADSVAMLDLFSKTSYKFAIAHCNFKLRGSDSDNDELFVKELAKKYNVEFFSKICLAKEYTLINNVSIEMAARKLRYEWFNQLATAHNFTKIATAHHSDDSVETILINLSRKTGLNGLLGVPVKNKNIIRPLLFTNKKQILAYCETNNLNFRTDKTNFETDFYRNKIRNIIIPEFEKVNPAFSKNVLQTSKNLQLQRSFFENHFEVFVKKCIIFDENTININTKILQKFEPKELFLYEFLKNYGFNFTQIEVATALINKKSGKIFLSNTHRLIIERESLSVTQITNCKSINYIIKKDTQELTIDKNKPTELKLRFSKSENIKIEKDTNIGLFDYEKLKFPLTLRKWQKGDYFYPIGMNGKRKKLSDFFKDLKFSQLDKENAWLLESDGKIIWIVKKRLDDRFKITAKTRKILKVECGEWG